MKFMLLKKFSRLEDSVVKKSKRRLIDYKARKSQVFSIISFYYVDDELSFHLKIVQNS